MKKGVRQIIFYVLLVAVIIVVCAFLFNKNKNKDDVLYSDIYRYFSEEQVESFSLNSNNNVLTLTLKPQTGENEGKEVQYKLSYYQMIFDTELMKLINTQIENGTIKDADFKPPKQYSAWVSYLPIVLIVIVLIVVYILMARQMSGMGGGKAGNFAKARVKVPSTDGKDKVTFADVAGADEEKEELEEVVEFLKNPEKFANLGAKIPHGVLLVGPPGTGKTLLAKAVAGEAGVPFFSISGSDFVEMYVGVGASRVRDLFETARKSPASIVFIDEIDAVGRQRGAGLGGGHDEREQTLNQLLVEMDGFGSHDGIIVIAATNRADILDHALLRPGRFDRQIVVNYPDINGRVEILKVHSKNKPIEPDVDFKEIARMTAGFTGADLANLLNEAALLASRRNKSLIGMDDISEAYIKVIAGPKKKSRVMKPEEKKKTAYHEAGHAILAYALDLDPVQQISIIPSGHALGYTLNPPAEDKYSVYKSELKKKISMLLGGRAAEEIIFGDVSGGASNDIERATKTAKNMVMRLGMSDELGPRCFGTDQGEVFLGRDFSSSPDYSEEIAAKIDSEIHEIIAGAYDEAKSILRANSDKLHFIAEFLLKNEIMDGDQFKYTMETPAPFIEDVEAIAEQKKKKSREANAEEAKKKAEEAEARARAEAEAEAQTDPENTDDSDSTDSEG